MGTTPERFDMSTPKLEFGDPQKDDELEKLRCGLRETQAEVSAQNIFQSAPQQGIATPGAPEQNALLDLMEKRTDVMMKAVKTKLSVHSWSRTDSHLAETRR